MQLSKLLFPAGLVIKVVRTNANPAGNYMFKVKNGNSRLRCEICSKLTIKTPERQGSVVVFGRQFEDSILENSIYVPFL